MYESYFFSSFFFIGTKRTEFMNQFAAERDVHCNTRTTPFFVILDIHPARIYKFLFYENAEQLKREQTIDKTRTFGNRDKDVRSFLDILSRASSESEFFRELSHRVSQKQLAEQDRKSAREKRVADQNSPPSSK